MKMAMKEGQILIKEADNTQFTIIKSWGKMKWSKAERMFYGPAEIELLNKLAGIVRLPGPIEAERQRLNIIAQAVDAERMKPELMTCHDIVATGRYPYTGRLGMLTLSLIHI